MIEPTARRRVHGVSAVFLPFDDEGTPDLDAFRTHLCRTREAGLEPAVNMDTGFGPHVGPKARRAVLDLTAEALGGAPFVAGAMPFGSDDDALTAYRREIATILERGGTPIVFPSDLFAGADAAGVEALYRRVLSGATRALAFELGPMFAPFGRIFDDETVRRLMDIDEVIGLKHSSLSRRIERDRLALRDRRRPEFRIYSGNDLAIDMIREGSDYLLGLSTFDPAGFGLRDRWWASGDERADELEDALQALGRIAFRDPVPAYKDSAAVYLRLTGAMPAARPHPDTPRRPDWEPELLAPFAAAVDAARRAPAGSLTRPGTRSRPDGSVPAEPGAPVPRSRRHGMRAARRRRSG